jgi:hypothetical protein
VQHAWLEPDRDGGRPPGSERILGQSLSPADDDQVGVMFTLSGRGVHQATNVLAGMDGVRGVDRVDEEAE